MSSRRKFLTHSALAAAALATPTANASPDNQARSITRELSLCGNWNFHIDPNNAGTRESWQAPAHSTADWPEVTVPHTWQVHPALADYRGLAWYRRIFDAPQEWRESAVRLEFKAVFHTATVWVNGQLAGEHARKGYTAFSFDIASLLHFGQPNLIAVRVDNAFNDHMLPRGRSSDWAHDGGIYRPVDLLITPRTFIEQIDVDAVPNHNHPGCPTSRHSCETWETDVTISAHCRNADTTNWTGSATARIFDDATGLIIATSKATPLTISPGAAQTITFHETISNPKLWHFDSPELYRAEIEIVHDGDEHRAETTFGIRKFEIKDATFHLNGEPVRLMGVERMAGSYPEFGMAEPADCIDHDHRDLKNLNCVFTRVHWPQDRRVLDFCDRHGILVQLEIPAWGPDTFEGMGAQPAADIVQNGLEQLREMIQRDGNHPSVVAWGLCNEINGQNPPAYQFAKRMLEEAKRLDPSRLCSYASHSLGSTPERDVAGLMDFIEANEYYGTWAPGNPTDVARLLDSLHAAFPGKPIVISEYGYCACTPDRPEGDVPRIEILKTHTDVLRSKDFVAGAIFFCYNDYRTHVGDRGTGGLQQRVHGVVDLYGVRKPSYAVLRDESSPIESLNVNKQPDAFHLSLKTRSTLPAYTLRGYKLRGVYYGQGGIPVETREVDLHELAPGATLVLPLTFAQNEPIHHVRFDVLRPTGFAAYSVEWKP